MLRHFPGVVKQNVLLIGLTSYLINKETATFTFIAAHIDVPGKSQYKPGQY